MNRLAMIVGTCCLALVLTACGEKGSTKPAEGTAPQGQENNNAGENKAPDTNNAAPATAPAAPAEGQSH